MKSWQVLKIWGIPLRIHPLWILLIIFFAWSISNQINLTLSETFDVKDSFFIGFSTSLLFFGSIIFHQFFHTIVSLKNGVKIRNITFVLLGATLQIDKECQNPLGNIKIALVRPISCLLTSSLLIYLSNFSQSSNQILINIFLRVGIFNLFLCLINLIPIGSLDGGILFKSIVWKLSGSKYKGRNQLNRLTLLLSIFAFFFGIYCFLIFNFYYGLIFFLFGILGINTSQSENQFLKIERILKDRNISEIKLNPLRKIDFDLTLKEFQKLDQDNKDKFDRNYFIIKDGRWVGFITEDILKEVSLRKWESKLVNELKIPISKFPTEKENSPLWKIIERIEETEYGILLITNSYDIPLGIVNRKNIGFFVLEKLGVNLSNQFVNKFNFKNKYPLGIDLPRIIHLMKKKGDIE